MRIWQHFLLITSLLVSGFITGCQSQEPPKITDEQKLDVDNFQDWLNELLALDSASRASTVAKMLDTLSTSPYVQSDNSVYFLYHGRALNVQVGGDFNGWNPNRFGLNQLPGTDLWYRSQSFEPHARLDYKFVINGSNWILDPLNPRRVPGGYGPNSELAMPAYVQPAELQVRSDVPVGQLSASSWSSDLMGRTYPLHIYLPPAYKEDESYASLYVHDGSDYLNLGAMPTILNNLIAEEKIEPLVVVFVDPTDRMAEYGENDRMAFAHAMASELVPEIDGQFATKPECVHRGTLGASLGGNISAILSFSYPNVFGKSGWHSGAFQLNDFATNDIVQGGVAKELRVASVWGSYEGGGIPANMQGITEHLAREGYGLYAAEYPEGHSWGLWRATTDEILMFLFPRQHQ